MSRASRFVAGAVAITGFALAAVVLQLSDGVGRNFGRFTRYARTGIGRVEEALGIRVLGDHDVPYQPDAIGHVALWFVGMLIVGFALRRRVPLLLLAVLMFGVSLSFEVAQQLFTSSRAAETSDAVANGVGIGAALIVVGAIGWLADRWGRASA